MFQVKQSVRLMVTQAVAISLLVGFSGISAQAEQVVKDLDDGVPVTLNTDINGETATAGQPFEAQLAEAIRYKDRTLPAGTQFRGQISKVQHSRIFNRPGYVILDVQEATLPGGQTFSFAQYKDPNKKIHNKDATTFGSTIGTQLPYTAAGLGVTIPLRYAADVRNASTVPIGLGVRMLTGMIVGPFRNSGVYENKPAAYKVARGALDGSGIPRAVQFLAGRDEEVQLESGEQVRLYMNERGLEDLFKASSGEMVSQPATTAPAE